MQQTLGDFLITYLDPEVKLPTRSSSPWKHIGTFNGAALWVTESDACWHGFPLTTYQDDRWQIWVIGEFYGDPQPNLPHALETSADLNGHFIIFAYEHARQRWHTLTDRFGTIHAYHASEGKRSAVGTFSPAVAAAASSKTLDWHAIGSFCQFGFFLGDRTYWKDVRVFKPATHTLFDACGIQLSQQQTWRWYHEPDPSFNQADALAEFTELFHTVTWEQVHGKALAVPISGGLDSRSTLVPLTDPSSCQAEDLFFFSYGYGEDSVETAIARQLARKRNLDLTTWAIRPYLFDQLERALAAIEGFQDLTLTRQVDVADQLGEQASHVLAAHWMDVWLDDMGFLDVSEQLTDQALVMKMLKKFTKNGAQHLLPLFRDWLPPDQEGWVSGQIMGGISQLDTIRDLDFKVKAWKTWQWSFRWTLPSLRAYQLGLVHLVPFYDQRLADFFCRQPSKPMAGRKFQIEYLKRYGPDLAQVPWQTYYDANLYQYLHFNTWMLPRRALKKLGRMIKRKQVFERNWEVQFLNPAGRAGLEQWLLTPGLKLHDVTPRSELAAFLSDFYAAPGAANGYAASMLLTLSAWLEAYG